VKLQTTMKRIGIWLKILELCLQS